MSQAHDYVVAYHGTADIRLPAILGEGLKAGKSGGSDRWALKHKMYAAGAISNRPPSVYVSTDRHFALQFSEYTSDLYPGAKPALVTLHIPKVAFNTLFVPDEYSVPHARNLFEALTGEGEIVNYRTERGIPRDWIVDQKVYKRLLKDA